MHGAQHRQSTILELPAPTVHLPGGSSICGLPSIRVHGCPSTRRHLRRKAELPIRMCEMSCDIPGLTKISITWWPLTCSAAPSERTVWLPALYAKIPDRHSLMCTCISLRAARTRRAGVGRTKKASLFFFFCRTGIVFRSCVLTHMSTTTP